MKISRLPHKGKHAIRNQRRERGSAALADVAISSLVFSIALIMSIRIISDSNTEMSAYRTADQQIAITKALANYYLENQTQIQQDVNSESSACASSEENGYYIYSLSNLPGYDASGQLTCKSIDTTGQMPGTNNGYRNRYGQEYVAVIAPQSTVMNGVEATPGRPTVRIGIMTIGGQSLNSAALGAFMTRAGMASQVHYPENGGPSMFGQIGLPLPASLLTGGHTYTDATYYADNTLDNSLHRNSELGDTDPQTMNTSLYLNSTNPSNQTPNNINLNGRPHSYDANVLSQNAKNNYGGTAYTGSGSRPTNGLFGARQLDTQTLTAGNSVANPYETNADQTNAETNAGYTVNDTKNYPNTILANANLDVTAGYRMTTADGYHITADSTSIEKDAQGSNTDISGATPNGTATDLGTWQSVNVGHGIPGVTWDNAKNGAGNTVPSGLMNYQSWDPAETSTYSPASFGINRARAQAVIATYSKNGSSDPVGFEADGGMRAPIYYDQSDMTYFVAPNGPSHMGNIYLSGTYVNDPQSPCNDGGGNYTCHENGSLYANSTAGRAFPAGWNGGVMAANFYTQGNIYGNKIGSAGYLPGQGDPAGWEGGLSTWDVISHGTIAGGVTEDGKPSVFVGSWVNNQHSGVITSNASVSGQIFRPTYFATNGAPCNVTSYTQWGGSSSYDIQNGDIARDNDGNTLACVDGRWHNNLSPFSNMYQERTCGQYSGTNNTGVTEFINAEVIAGHKGATAYFYVNGHEVGYTNNTVQDGRVGQTVSFIVPPGSSWSSKPVYRVNDICTTIMN